MAITPRPFNEIITAIEGVDWTSFSADGWRLNLELVQSIRDAEKTSGREVDLAVGQALISLICRASKDSSSSALGIPPSELLFPYPQQSTGLLKAASRFSQHFGAHITNVLDTRNFSDSDEIKNYAMYLTTRYLEDSLIHLKRPDLGLSLIENYYYALDQRGNSQSVPLKNFLEKGLISMKGGHMTRWNIPLIGASLIIIQNKTENQIVLFWIRDDELYFTFLEPKEAKFNFTELKGWDDIVSRMRIKKGDPHLASHKSWIIMEGVKNVLATPEYSKAQKQLRALVYVHPLQIQEGENIFIHSVQGVQSKMQPRFEMSAQLPFPEAKDIMPDDLEIKLYMIRQHISHQPSFPGETLVRVDERPIYQSDFYQKAITILDEQLAELNRGQIKNISHDEANLLLHVWEEQLVHGIRSSMFDEDDLYKFCSGLRYIQNMAPAFKPKHYNSLARHHFGIERNPQSSWVRNLLKK